MAIENIEGVKVVEYVDELSDWRRDCLFEVAKAEFLGGLRKTMRLDLEETRYGIYLEGDNKRSIGSFVVDLLRNCGLCLQGRC